MQALVQCIVARTVLEMPVAPLWECIDALEHGRLVWERSIAEYFELEIKSLTDVLWADPLRWHRYVAIIVRHADAMEASHSAPPIDASFHSSAFDDCIGDSLNG